MVLQYDDTDPLSIEQYGKKLVGKTFGEVISDSKLPYDAKQKLFESYGNKNRKGGLGNLIEELHFEYKANSDQNADFPKAGVELKASPYQISKKQKLSAGERMTVTMIDYNNPVEDDFEKSHVFEKIEKILMVYYLRDRLLPSNLEYSIDYVKLYSPTEEDLLIIKEDYKKINDKIKAGKAHELSEGDTIYLGASTKGSTAEKSTVSQYYNPDVKARKRAFSLKSGFMTQVLNNYIIKDKDTYEPIVKNPLELKEKSFEEIVKDKIERHIGKSDEQLCLELNVENNNNKGKWSTLAFRMLGIKSNKAEEFRKANIIVKAIRISEANTIIESSPLPTMPLSEIAVEEWDESHLNNYLEESKFLFVVFKEESGVLVLKGCQFYNIPKSLLEGEVRRGWENIQKVLKEGVQLTKKQEKSRVVIENNFPKMKDNEVIHIRPHSAKSYYLFEDGSTHGAGKEIHSDLLPDGRRMTKQSFWLNNSFVYSILEERLKK